MPPTPQLTMISSARAVDSTFRCHFRNCTLMAIARGTLHVSKLAAAVAIGRDTARWAGSTMHVPDSRWLPGRSK